MRGVARAAQACYERRTTVDGEPDLMSRVAFAAVLSALATPAAAAEFPSCVAGLERQAVAAGVPAAVAADAFDGIESQDRVLELAARRPEFTLAIWDYLAFLVD